MFKRNKMNLSESGVKTHQLSQFSLVAMAKRKRESGASGRRAVAKGTKKEEKNKSKVKESSKKKKSTSSSSESESSIDDAEVQMANAIGATFGLFLVCDLY